MKVLMLGCGKARKRNIIIDGKDDFKDDSLTTIDIDPSCNPDIVMDIGELSNGDRLPFDNKCFDEIHAYDVLEHLGTMGDWRGYFTEFKEYHRILKPDGKFFILVPIGEDAFADPGHSRFFHQTHFWFLCQKFYEHETKNHTTATDYRWFWKKNFEIDYMEKVENHHLAVILRKA